MKLRVILNRIRTLGWTIEPDITPHALRYQAYEVTSPRGHSTIVSIGEIHTQGAKEHIHVSIASADVARRLAVTVAKRNMKQGDSRLRFGGA